MSGSVPSGTTRSQQKAETRARILAAAIEVFTREPVVTTPVDSVAAAAGVSKATLFFHFGSRIELLEAVGAELWHSGAHSTFRPAEPGLIPALRQYFAAQRKPAARLLWDIGDVATVSRRPGPDLAYCYLISAIEDRLVEDGVEAGKGRPLAQVLAPAALTVARRAAFGQADDQELERFVVDVEAMLTLWSSGERPGGPS